eukprot:747043-Hanusia_phi.AAC.5
MIRERVIKNNDTLANSLYQRLMRLSTLQLLIFACIIAMWVTIVRELDTNLSNLIISSNEITTKDRPSQPPDFFYFILLLDSYFILNGVNMLLSFFRCIEYLEFNYSLSRLTETFKFMRKTLPQFLLIFCIVVLSFMLMSHMMFGSKLAMFSSFGSALSGIFSVLIGDINYFELMDSDSVAAPIFFYPLLFVMIFVVLNLVIAIIIDAHVAMTAEKDVALRSWMKDVVDLPLTTQLWDGFLHYLQPVRFLLPQSLSARYDRVSKENIIDAFNVLDGIELSRLEDSQVNLERISLNDLRLLLRDRNITEQRLASIFEHYRAWADEEEPVDVEKLAETNDTAYAEMLQEATTGASCSTAFLRVRSWQRSRGCWRRSKLPCSSLKTCRRRQRSSWTCSSMLTSKRSEGKMYRRRTETREGQGQGTRTKWRGDD